MSGTATQLERRRLNEEIENAFITAAQAASNVEMKLSMGKGTIFGDSQDFYQYFSYLIRLTSQLKEMETEEGTELDKLKKRVDTWRRRKIGSNAQNAEIEKYLDDGLEIFDEYYKTLMHVGIIALPTKKGG